MSNFRITYGKEQYHLIQDKLAWCRETLGPMGKGWDFTTGFGRSNFYFDHRQNAAFMLLAHPGGHLRELEQEDPDASAGY